LAELPVRLFGLGEERVENECGVVKNVVRRREDERRTTTTWETTKTRWRLKRKRWVAGRIRIFDLRALI